MAITYTTTTIEKLEALLKTQGYKVAYEKGNFRTAACVLNQNKVVVVNKFSTVESKVNSMSDLVKNITFDDTLLSDKQKNFLLQLQQTTLQF